MKLIYLYALMSVEATLLGAELVASQLTHSLVILTDAYRTLYNTLSIILLIISFKMSTQTTVKNTFGWARIEILGMLSNMAFLVALTFSLIVEGIQQLVHSSHEISQPTNPYLLFIFGFCGLVLNLLYFNIVSDAIMSHTKQRTGSERPQERVVFKEMLATDAEQVATTSGQTSGRLASDRLMTTKAEKEKKIRTYIEEQPHRQNYCYGMFRDLTGSVVLVVCGLCVLYANDTLAHISDPILGMVSALVFCAMLYPNLKNTGLILLQTVPENINVDRLKREILREFPIILDIHDLHVWGLTAARIIATCHVILPDLSSQAYDQFSKSLNDFFHRKGVLLATVQPEFSQQMVGPNEANDRLSCLMKCSKFSNTNCDSFTCCSAAHSDHNGSDPSGDEHTFQEVVPLK